MVQAMVAIMGAGKGQRFGGDKLDALLQDRPLGYWALNAARALGAPIIYVTGPEQPAFLSQIRYPLQVMKNEAPDKGMGTSIAIAAAAARIAGTQTLLLMLADMPFVRRATLQQLVTQTDIHTAVASRYPDDSLGPPVCFGANHFALLEKLDDHIGARNLLKGAIRAKAVAVLPEELFDIDTVSDLDAARHRDWVFDSED